MCDRRAPVNIKSMILRTVVRLAMVCGLETAAMTKRQDLEAAEVRMIRFSLGVTGMGGTRNEGNTSEGLCGEMQLPGKMG